MPTLSPCTAPDRHPSTAPCWLRPLPEPIPTQVNAFHCALQPTFPLSSTPSPPGAGGLTRGPSPTTQCCSPSLPPSEGALGLARRWPHSGSEAVLSVTATRGFPSPVSTGSSAGRDLLPLAPQAPAAEAPVLAAPWLSLHTAVALTSCGTERLLAVPGHPTVSSADPTDAALQPGQPSSPQGPSLTLPVLTAGVPPAVPCLWAGTVPGIGARRAALPPHRSPLLGTDVVPPLGKEGDLRPDEAPARVLLHLQHHAVENVLRLVIVVLVKGLDPACQHT